MGSQEHIVQKFTIELGLPDSERAFALQTKISNDHKHLLLDSMNEVFDRLIGEDEVVMIDKLEIDLGHVSHEMLDHELPSKVKQEIEEALVNLLQQARSDKNNFTEVQLTTSSGEMVTVQVKSQHVTRSLFNTLIYFLEYGTVPWTADRKQKPGARFLVSEAMIHHPEELRKVLQSLSRKKHVFRRLAFQLPEDQLQYLAAILGSDFSASLDTLVKSASSWIIDILEERKRYFSGNKSSVKKSSEKRSSENPSQAIATGKNLEGEKNSFITTDFSMASLSPSFLKQRIWEETLFYFASHGNETGQGESAMVKYVAAILERVLASIGVKLTDLIPAEQKAKREYAQAVNIAVEQLQRTHKNKATEAAPVQKAPQAINEEFLPDVPEAEEGIYIRNAGLVIIAPYLPGFFRNLGLVEGKEFVNEEAKWKAVHMLQWLVDGDKEITEEEENTSEHDLVLNKIICGLEIAEPVPAFMELTAADKEEGISLLKAIIANWDIIKNSSVHTLRVTFLQKEGRLKREEENWQLLIQRDSAVDLLIDKLPWGIAMTKLPWNKAIVYVEW